MTDRYEKIRKALEMGPTPGSWYLDGEGIRALVRDANGVIVAARHRTPGHRNETNMRLIAACDPDTIRALLAERNALAAENERLAMALWRYGVHAWECTAMDIPICTCGLDAALAMGAAPKPDAVTGPVDVEALREGVEYEYEVWQDGALQAGGRELDYASAKSEARHYAMMYSQDGPVEVRIYEKRLLLTTAQAKPKLRRYNASGSLSEYGVFPESDAQ